MPDLLLTPSLALQSRVDIAARGGRLSADLLQSAAPAGWVVLTCRPGDPLERFFSSQVARQALAAGWATLILETTTADIRRAAEQLQAATLWLRVQPEAAGLPVAFVAPGRGAAVALQAAAGGAPVSSVLSWNGRPELAWSSLRSVRAPSLLMVNQQASRLTRWLNQLARWQMGPASAFALTAAASPWNDSALAWLQRPPAPATAAGLRHPQLAPVGRVLASGALVAAALAMPFRGLRATQAHPLSFGNGQVVNSSQIKGDGVGQVRSKGPRKQDARFAGGLTLEAKHVKGDGIHGPSATGSQGLVDAGGLKFFVNTNITFVTTKSASGAASEASFTHAVPASTKNGGTTASTLNDMFDGYNGLCLSLNGATGPCATGDPNYILYNQLGPAALECAGVISPTVKRQVVLPTQAISGTLAVSRKVFVPDNDEFARWMNIVTNTTGTTQTVTLIMANNLGSDTNTKIFTSSTGITSPINSIVNAPFWIGSFQDWSGTTSSDVRSGHLIYGPNARVGLSSLNFVNGNDQPWWSYHLTLAPDQTQIVLNYAIGQPTQAAVISKTSQLVGMPPNALQCMTPAEQAEVVNFALSHVITPTAGLHGTITPGTPQTVSAGGAITFTVAPNAGYRILDVGVDAISKGPLSLYAFTNVTATHTISASFGALPLYLPIIRR